MGLTDLQHQIDNTLLPALPRLGRVGVSQEDNTTMGMAQLPLLALLVRQRYIQKGCDN